MKHLARRILSRLFVVAWSAVQLQGAALIVAGMVADQLTQPEPMC